MIIKAESPEDYISKLPEERKEAFSTLRDTVKENLPEGFEEWQSGMVEYVVPKSIYPAGYHCKPFPPLPFIYLASQKNFIALYHMGMYAKPELLNWFVEEYPKHCKYKLDMGKSCVRFKRLDDIPFALIAELVTKMSVEEWIEIYEANVKR